MSPQIIIDKKGRKTGVILSIGDYKKLQENSGELADIKAYDKAKCNLKNQKVNTASDVIV